MKRFKKRDPAVSDCGSDGSNESAGPALAIPVAGIDPEWRERIELAKRAYQDGKKLREGKPITFRMSRCFSLSDGPSA